jgi:hypothetical protein
MDINRMRQKSLSATGESDFCRTSLLDILSSCLAAAKLPREAGSKRSELPILG